LAATFVGLVLIVIGLLIQRIKSNPDKTMERSAQE
jgi:ABC-type Fe3+-siderophore transport system permease subunit